MHREHHRWYSPSLNREMDLLVVGHSGARVLVFPSSMGRFFEWEDRGMMNSVGDMVNNGHLQFYCVDSIDSESWYCDWAHPSGRAQRHAQYDSYLVNEVMPLSRAKNDNPFLIVSGASFGAYHAMNFALKHPEQTGRVIAMSGLFDIRRFTGGYSDDNVYFNNPMQFIPNENDAWRLSQLQRLDIIIASGRDDKLISSSRELSGTLWNKGIGNALREWDGWSHDWPYWQMMFRRYVGGNA
jgi:esterase/lipase superfamily enzyme